jgi:hypothetical protein
VTKVTVDLDDRVATALNRWISREAADLGPPMLNAGEVIGAAIVVCLRYTDVTDSCAPRSGTSGQPGGSAAEADDHLGPSGKNFSAAAG